MDEPPIDVTDPVELLLGYLDGYRATLLRKLDGLSDAELRAPAVPSGWCPLEVVKHLAFMERRWLRWGFSGEALPDPLGDEIKPDVWRVGEHETLADLAAMLDDQAARTRRVAAGAGIADRAATGGKFGDPADCPTLGWILCHVLQEYARHVGHLDIARELADGTVGE